MEGRETRSDFVRGIAAEASEADRSADLIRDQMIMVFVTSLSINQINKTTVYFLFNSYAKALFGTAPLRRYK